MIISQSIIVDRFAFLNFGIIDAILIVISALCVEVRGVKSRLTARFRLFKTLNLTCFVFLGGRLGDLSSKFSKSFASNRNLANILKINAFDLY